VFLSFQNILQLGGDLAKHENKLASVPRFPMLPEAEPRQSFVDQPEFDKLLAALQMEYPPFVLYLYTTGPRSGLQPGGFADWYDSE
jgi:hypothetical protein